MMLSWKMAACLAAGNTVVIKPAQVLIEDDNSRSCIFIIITSTEQVSPLTALKFAELTVEAGFPPGVINVLPGTGRMCGQVILIIIMRIMLMMIMIIMMILTIIMINDRVWSSGSGNFL